MDTGTILLTSQHPPQNNSGRRFQRPPRILEPRDASKPKNEPLPNQEPDQPLLSGPSEPPRNRNTLWQEEQDQVRHRLDLLHPKAHERNRQLVCRRAVQHWLKSRLHSVLLLCPKTSSAKRSLPRHDSTGTRQTGLDFTNASK